MAGTTITIPVPLGYGTGFGLSISRAMTLNAFGLVDSRPDPPNLDPTFDDLQRGELTFALWRGGAFLTYLPVRYITRVHLDEGTPAGVSGAAGYAKGQVLALVDIPRALSASPAGANDSIIVQRWKRPLVANGSGQLVPFFEDPPQIGGVSWRGWGALPVNGFGPEDPSQTIPIQIVAAPSTTSYFSPSLGWDHFFSGLEADTVEDDLPLLVPHPKAQVWLSNPFATPVDPPAAVEFEVEYPRQWVEILGVELVRNRRSDALALLEPDALPLPNDCVQAETGSFRVRVVDPAEQTNEIYIAFRVRNFDKACRQRLTPAHFVIKAETVRGYDRNGAPVPGYDVNDLAVVSASY